MSKPLTPLFLAAALALSGCEWDDWYKQPAADAQVPESAGIDCAQLRNSQTGACEAPPRADAATARRYLASEPTTVLDAGALYRGAPLQALVEVVNESRAVWNGHVSAAFDAACAGDEDFDIIPLQPLRIRVDGAAHLQMAATCADMPLGQRAVSVLLHGPDPVEVLERFVIVFDLQSGPPPE